MIITIAFGFVFGAVSIASNRMENRPDKIGIAIGAVLIGLVIGRVVEVYVPPLYLLAFLGIPAGVVLARRLQHW